MDRFRRAPIVAVGLMLAVAALAFAGQDAAVTTTARLTPSEMEAFLLKAKILDVRDAGGGVTGSRRAKLTDGTLTHDAHIQTVDIAKPVFEAGEHTELNFKDTYRFNIAGYRLARLLGIDTVPMSVERNVNGKTAAVTWWVDDVQMDEKERLQTKDDGAQPAAHVQSDPGHAHLGRADSESRSEPGEHPVDQRLDDVADRSHAGVSPR